MPKRNNPFRQERIDFARQQRIAEKQLYPYFRKALRKQVAGVIEWVRLNDLQGVPIEALIDRSVWQDVYPKIFQLIGMKLARQEFYRQRTLEGMETKASAIDFLVDVWSGILRDAALTYTYGIERALNSRTVRIIQEALGGDYSLGMDRLGRIRLFEKDLDGRMKMRAGTISRTESTTIANLGKDLGARSWIEQQGGQGYKAWLGRNDARERPSHLSENNTIVEIDGYYDLDGELAIRPGDLTLSAKQRLNCRCTQTLMSQNRYNALVKRKLIVNGKIVD